MILTRMQIRLSALFISVGALALVPFASGAAQVRSSGGSVKPDMPMSSRSLGNPGGGQAPKAVEYMDPNGRFVLVAPPGVTMREPGKRGEIRMQSPKGYVVNFQSGPIDPKLTTKDMAVKLERRYLGPGKPWSIKMGQRNISVGGLSAYDALYQGSGTRVRVVVARGRGHDFIFLFIAPPRSFDVLETEFDWILKHFNPAPAERGMTPEHFKKAGRNPKEMDLRTFRQASALRANRDVRPTGAAVRRFQSPEIGYSIDYPADWTAVQPTSHRLVISGREGTDAFYATVTVQNVQPGEDTSGAEMVRSVVGGLKRELEQNTRGIKYFGERPFTYDRAGLRLQGQQFLATYTHDGVRFRKWAMILPRDGGSVLHIWSYTAPEERFNAYRLIAEDMLKSWTVSSDLTAGP